MKRIVPILVITAIGAGGFYLARHARRLNDNGRLRFSGNIELTEIHLAFKRPGRLETRDVDEGVAVSSGSVVARLGATELENQREKAQAAVAIADSRLAMLDEEIRMLEETIAATIDSRQAELGQAKASLRELESGSRTQEIAEADAAVERAKTESDLARRDWERIEGLYNSGVASAAQRDAARARLDAAKAALDQANQRVSLVREGARTERIDAARALVERSKAGLRGARATQTELELKKLERSIRYAEVRSARAELAIIETQLADSVLVAPVSGVVLTKSAEPGEVLAAGSPVVTLGDLDHPWVRAYIDETDLGRVRLGDRALVRSDSFPDKTYEGRVSFIASEAEFTPKQIQTLEERTRWVYRVKIDLPNLNHELKLNMPVEGEILPNER
ncbi:efflux RND transporter periplasmic adaptor subunit [Candidatus Sumerlaeota bacterium]|nr:efflux RND transporter periplasmic adaptor subunit [Candidatus Sumerlaeota bacterium]